MPQTIRLESVTPEGRAEIARIESGAVTIGRELENGLVVDSESVSRSHGVIFEVGSQWAYQDLGSTNGSWINDVRVKPYQIRLLRHGDLIQLADFLFYVFEADTAADELGTTGDSDIGQSLLIFENSKFRWEYMFDVAANVFRAGGPGSDLEIAGIDNSTGNELAVRQLDDRLELTTLGGTTPVAVNGMAVGGVTALNDGDEIQIEDFQLLVNGWPSRGRGVGHVRAPSSGDPAPLPSFSSVHLVGERTAEEDTEWESEAAKRRAQSGKRFVFGTPSLNELDPRSTLALPPQAFPDRPGFETNPGLRFSGAAAFEEPAPAVDNQSKIIIVGGVLLLLLLGSLIAYLLIML